MLPFVLPILGVATGAGLGLLLILEVIAAISIVTTLRRLWRLQHPRRWQYLLVALALAVLVGFFLVNGARAVRLADMGEHMALLAAGWEENAARGCCWA